MPGRRATIKLAGKVYTVSIAVSMYIPTGPLSVSERQLQEIGYFYLVQKLRATDFEAPML